MGKKNSKLLFVSFCRKKFPKLIHCERRIVIGICFHLYDSDFLCHSFSSSFNKSLARFSQEYHNINPEKCRFQRKKVARRRKKEYNDGMNKSEAKFHNTAVKMDGALVKLLEQKEFKEISIREICEEAGVNRSTFYAHYDNLYDLLKETQERAVSDFFASFSGKVKTDFSKMTAEELIFISPQYLVPYLTFIKKNRRLYEVYNNSGAFQIGEMDKQLIENIFVPIYAKNGVTDKRVVEYMSHYFISGVTAITMEWVKRGCEDDILFICEVISVCVRPFAKANEIK